ncbi:abortive infection Abi-like protein [Methylobacter tundripaludum]|uniref:Abortive infection Abi-like protein n=1 Tax=Methylobacter tundripaludum TaxID=173365 RepID=A0A2S6HIM4_9GAMM|nr:abortive infection family protein [Methylobacter tundripaludum]PPK77335.1 abortive infection Abi-like protein [Methylobacter tundripaludum]
MELPISDLILVAISKLVDDAKVESREPTHYDLDVQIKKAGLTESDPKTQGQSVGKAKRIRATLNWALENNPQAGSKLVELILSQVRAVGGFRETSPNYAGKEQILNAISVFDTENFSLSENGDIRPKVLDTLKGKHLTDALQAYAQRAKRGSEDAALLSGTGKDLLEATAKHIIHTKFGNHPTNANFPTLLGQAYAALRMATPEDTKTANEPAIKDYERALFSMATSINRVRNKEGTGHGKLCITALSPEESHSIIETVGIIAEFLLNRLNEGS